MRKFLALLILLIAFGAAQAQTATVFGVLFYSPTCPHCHQVIENDLPRFQSEFGDQWQLMLIDVTTQQGSALFQAALTSMNIDSRGVPLMIIGDQVLVGSGEIPNYAPQIIRDGLANGGIGYPPVPELITIFETQFGEFQTVNIQAGGIDLWQRLTADPAGNAAAVLVLIALVASFVAVIMASLRAENSSLLRKVSERGGWYAVLLLILMGFGLITSILIKSTQIETTLIGAIIGIILLIALGMQSEKKQLIELPAWIAPLLMIAGLLVAGYLAYIEVTATEAVCGTIGDCNTVQQSPYASIAGIPIGVLGVAGYIVMLILWALNRWMNASFVKLALALVLIGATAFSIYLTFLEPFVIGASCAWCLTSAVIVALLLWLIVPLLVLENRSTEPVHQPL